MTLSYRMWDSRYSEEGFAYGTEPNAFLQETIESGKLLEQLQGDKKRKCLMLAEGEGRNGVYLAQRDFDVTGVDSSAVGLQKAQELARERSVSIETIVADLATYELGKEKYDLIVGIFCHLPPPIRERVLESIPKALKPGGYVLFECYTPAQLEFKTGGPPEAELMYSAEIFEQAFGQSLTIVRNEELVREVVEGKYHTGQAAVVQFIAKKEDV